MKVRQLPWAWIALVAGTALLMTSTTPVVFPDKWALARTLHPAVQVRFLALLRAIEALGYRIILTDAYRVGRDDPHGYGLALDLNLVHVATGQQYGMRVGKTSKADWEATGVPALMRKMGFRWGGDFTKPWKDLNNNWHAPYDPVHVDLCSRYPLAQLRPLAVKLAGSVAALASFDRRLLPLAA